MTPGTAMAAPLREAATNARGPARDTDRDIVGRSPQRVSRDAVFGYASAYMARGWACFMLSADKIPVRLCGSSECEAHRSAGPDAMESCTCLTCHGFYAATTDPARFAEILRRVPAGQLAIRTGAASGLVIAEVDPKNGGLTTLTALDEHGVLPGTLMVESGGGGIHFYYRHPGGYVTGGSHKLGRGVDVKADGGYVVASPSLHRSGRRYSWTGDGRFDYPLTPLHPEVLRVLRPEAPAPVPRTTSPVPFVRNSGVRRRAAGVLQTVMDAEDGNGNSTLFWAACTFAEMVAAGQITSAWAAEALERAAVAMNYPLPAARRTIRSGLTRGSR